MASNRQGTEGPLGPPEGMLPCPALGFSPVRLGLGLGVQTVSLCSLKPLCLWEVVIAEIGSYCRGPQNGGDSVWSKGVKLPAQNTDVTLGSWAVRSPDENPGCVRETPPRPTRLRAKFTSQGCRFSGFPRALAGHVPWLKHCVS